MRRAMSAMTDEEFDDLLRLREVAWTVRHSRSGDPRVLAALRDEIRARGDCIRLKDLAVTGRDLIEPESGRGNNWGRFLEICLRACWRSRRKTGKRHCWIWLT